MGLFSKKTDKEIIAEGRELYIKGDLTGANLKLLKLAIKGNAEACYWVGRICLEEADKTRDEKRREAGKVYLEKGVRLGNKDAAALLKKEFEQPDSSADKEDKTIADAKVKAEAEAGSNTKADEKQPAPQQAASEQKPAQPQKTEQQLRAEIEAELKARMEAELNARIEAELAARLEKEKQGQAQLQENAENTVVKARNLCAKGDIDTAEKMLAELLAEMPDFRSAQLLMEEIQDVKAWEKEKAEKERAEKAAAAAKAEEEEKERLKAELRARTEAKVRAEMEAEEKAKQAATIKAEEKQPATAENSDEIFTPQRLAYMEVVAAEGRERQRRIKEEYVDHWADNLDKIEQMYRSGDYERAFRQAYTYGEASARAINMMGAMYLTGRGTEKDLVKARDCFEMARRLGYMPAKYNEAMMVLQADEYEEEAFYMMELLADEGSLAAMLQVGKMYMEGIGVNADEGDGWFWLCQAARNGHMETARRIVELFFEQPEKLFSLRYYLDALCVAGDTELTKKMALLCMKGIPGKMDANLKHLRRYRDILKEHGYSVDDLM